MKKEKIGGEKGRTGGEIMKNRQENRLKTLPICTKISLNNTFINDAESLHPHNPVLIAIRRGF